ncbi:MAG: DNA alkylation repair protein [Treponema sp.]|nr:DNA alkylation repair protein [Treponema sp.]
MIYSLNAMTQIQKILFEYQDKKYGDFSAKLVPTLPREAFIGVRSPSYKLILCRVKELPPDVLQTFLQSLPHEYHEENSLHIALINKIKNYDECLTQLEHFLPYINSWAVSDSLNPPALKKNRLKLLPKLEQWIQDDAPFTKRVGMLLLMKYFLDDDFKPEYLELPSQIRSNEYYVNMMTAWLFAEALVKQWDATLPFIQKQKLDSWTHNKAIQKACESFRVSTERKEYLRSLKIK